MFIKRINPQEIVFGLVICASLLMAVYGITKLVKINKLNEQEARAKAALVHKPETTGTLTVISSFSDIKFTQFHGIRVIEVNGKKFVLYTDSVSSAITPY